MTETAGAAPEQPQEPTPEQLAALEKAKGAMAALDTRLRQARAAFEAVPAALEPDRAFAEAQLAEFDRLEAALAPRAGTPEHAYATTALKIQRRMFEGSRDLIAASLATAARNATIADRALTVLEACGDNANAWSQLVEDGILDPHFRFRAAEDEVAFKQGQAQVDLFLGLHLWLANVDGIDAILRATGHDPAVEPQDEAERAGRERMAQTFRDHAARDVAFAKWLGHLGVELDEAFTYFQWGSQSLRAMQGVAEEQRATRLADPDWKKLAAKTELLTELLGRVKAYPDVARFFPVAVPHGLAHHAAAAV